MKIWFLALAAFLTASLGAQDWETSLGAYFDGEGHSPFRGDHLEFSALESQLLTAHGHGWRNELKRKEADRRPMEETIESLQGVISFNLSPGAKTIVVQYHDGGTGTLLKLYVADIAQNGLTNGKARDGIFDVFARIDDPQGREHLFPFLSLKSGGQFSFLLKNDRGNLSLTIDGQTVVQQTRQAPGVYLKFGDYLQAQDPQTGRQAPHGQIPFFYPTQGIVQDQVIFSQLAYHPGSPGERKSLK